MSKRNVTTSIWTIVEAMQRSLEAQGLDVESVDNAVNLEVVSLVSGLRSRGAGRVASPEARDLGTDRATWRCSCFSPRPRRRETARGDHRMID